MNKYQTHFAIIDALVKAVCLEGGDGWGAWVVSEETDMDELYTSVSEYNSIQAFPWDIEYSNGVIMYFENQESLQITKTFDPSFVDKDYYCIYLNY